MSVHLLVKPHHSFRFFSFPSVTITTASYFSITVVHHLAYESPSFSICGLGCLSFDCFPVHLFSFKVILRTVWNTDLPTLPSVFHLQLTGLFQFTVRLLIETEARFTSVERITHYIKVRTWTGRARKVDYVPLESDTESQRQWWINHSDTESECHRAPLTTPPGPAPLFLYPILKSQSPWLAGLEKSIILGCAVPVGFYNRSDALTSPFLRWQWPANWRRRFLSLLDIRGRLLWHVLTSECFGHISIGFVLFGEPYSLSLLDATQAIALPNWIHNVWTAIFETVNLRGPCAMMVRRCGVVLGFHCSVGPLV